MTPFLDQAAHARVAALYANVLRLDAVAADLAQQTIAARERRAALDARLAVELGRAQAPDAATDDLAAQLAADPGADVVAPARERLRKSRAATADRDEAAAAEREVVERATGTVDAEIATLGDRSAETAAERGAAWGAFVRSAHDALAKELRLRWQALAADVVGPMVALAELRDPSVAPFPTPYVTGHQARLTPESSLALYGGETGREYLLHGDHTPNRRYFPDALPALLAALAG